MPMALKLHRSQARMAAAMSLQQISDIILIRPLPALTGLRCKGNVFSAWAGVRTDAKVTLLIDGKRFVEESGEVQLTDYGISGIPVFQLSSYAIRALDEGKKVTLSVNFLPEYTKASLQEYLKKRQEICPYQSAAELLLGLLPDKLIKMFRKQKKIFVTRLRHMSWK